MSDTNEMENAALNADLTCGSCNKTYRTLRGLNQHNSNGKCKNQKLPVTEPIVSSKPVNNHPAEPPKIEMLYKWGDYDNKSFEKNLHVIYEKIVYWRRNLFLLPTGKAGTQYIDETSRLMNAWLHHSPLKDVAFKAIMIMPSILLQKPKKDSKTKDHIAALERRLKLWQFGNLIELFKEAETIQKGLKSSTNIKTLVEISKQFAKQMNKGNVNGAIKLLTNKMQNGVLPLNNETLNLLKQKHPQPSPATAEVLLPDVPEKVHPIKFENINADTARNAVTKTKGGSGPSGMDADGWRRIFTFKSFGDSSTDLCKTFAAVIRKIYTEPNLSSSLEALLACRLIPLDKNPGLRPIGVGEILRRIAGKAAVSVIRDEILTSVGSSTSMRWSRRWLRSSYTCDSSDISRATNRSSFIDRCF